MLSNPNYSCDSTKSNLSSAANAINQLECDYAHKLSALSAATEILFYTRFAGMLSYSSSDLIAACGSWNSLHHSCRTLLVRENSDNQTRWVEVAEAGCSRENSYDRPEKGQTA